MALSGMRPVCADEPVCHVSYYDTDPFARWAGARLPTEMEWETAVADAPVVGNLLESSQQHPGVSPCVEGLAQSFGDVWEWTSSA
jgi:formylglycine-generating enzyme required for sulfatase activity